MKSQKLLSVNEAAELLGVSISTLRSWDKLNIFTSERTSGNHRRYRSEEIHKFLGQNQKLVTSFVSRHLDHLHNTWIEQSGNLPGIEAAGGFSKTEMSLMTSNQRNSADIDDRAFADDSSLASFAKEIAAPFLVQVQPLQKLTDLITYNRYRRKYTPNEDCGDEYQNSIGEMARMESCYLVQECEEVVTMTISKSEHDIEVPYDEEYTPLDYFFHIADQIDKHVISDLLDNSGTLITALPSTVVPSQEKIEELVLQASQSIYRKTFTLNNMYVVLPPELFRGDHQLERLTRNLKKSPQDIGHCKVYVSRLIPENQILVGCRGEGKHCGYYLCPHLLMHCERKYAGQIGLTTNHYESIVAKKLLREGSQYFARIDIK